MAALRSHSAFKGNPPSCEKWTNVIKSHGNVLVLPQPFLNWDDMQQAINIYPILATWKKSKDWLASYTPVS